MNCCRETVEMAVPPANRPAYRGIESEAYCEQYVAGFDTRGRPEGQLYLRSQQATREILELESLWLSALWYAEHSSHRRC